MTVRLIEWQVPYTWGTAIEITADKVINLLLRSEDNLLQVNQDNELYCDLQLANWIAPDDDFPVGVTTGIVNANDWRPYNWLLLHYETTSWAYAQWLYAWDGHFYLDGWTWTFKKIYYADEVDALFQQLVDMIGDWILTIQKNWTTVWTFTANQSTNTTVNITVPTALTDLTNDLVNDWKLTIKRNNTTIAEFTANDATNVFADISVPNVINNTSTVDSSNALSAAMWKDLQDQINNLNTIWRFLSLRDCATWLPQTNPEVSPYAYHSWDYFIVWAVDSTTNYKPSWSSYTIWVASTTVETQTVVVWDMYFYDGTNWILRVVAWQTLPIDSALSTTSINAVENRVVTNALNWKADLVSSATNWNLAWLDSTWNLTDSWVAAANVVQTTWNQTINGTKTFSVSPVVPSKITAATNTWTAIATEAQVYLKADATDLNTKTFYLSSTSDLTTAQAAYDYYTNWNNPIVVINWVSYIWVGGDSYMYVLMSPKQILATSITNDYSIIYQEALKFSLSSWTVTSVIVGTSSFGNEIYILDTRINYSTPYTPQYDWSPATKKYVDDNSGKATVSATAPLNPSEWDLRWETPILPGFFKKLYVYDWSNWIAQFNLNEFSWKTSSDSVNMWPRYNANVTPTWNVTITANAGYLNPWMQYIVKIDTWATAYTCSLSTWITNPFNEDLTLTANKTTYLVFLAIDDSNMVLFSARTEA